MRLNSLSHDNRTLAFVHWIHRELNKAENSHQELVFEKALSISHEIPLQHIAGANARISGKCLCMVYITAKSQKQDAEPAGSPPDHLIVF